MKRNQLQLSFSVDEDASSISDRGSTAGDDEADGLGECSNFINVSLAWARYTL